MAKRCWMRGLFKAITAKKASSIRSGGHENDSEYFKILQFTYRILQRSVEQRGPVSPFLGFIERVFVMGFVRDSNGVVR